MKSRFPTAKRVTQDQIARRIGITKQSVFYALSGRPELRGKLSPRTCQRIVETAQRLGYVPNLAARRLARERSNHRSTSFDQVGLIYISNPINIEMYIGPIFLAMVQGAEQALSRLHSSLTFVRVQEPSDWEKVDRLTRGGGLDGWLVYGAVNDDVLKQIRLTGLPYVIVGDHRCERPVFSVNVDFAGMGRLAARHLASLGHRRVAYFSGGKWFVYQEQSLAGFRAAQKELGLDDDKRLIGNFSMSTERRARWLKGLRPMPTAVFSPELGWATGLCQALDRLRVKVPRDMSVLACESVLHETKSQDLTRIELPMGEVGRQGVLLLNRIVSEPGMKPVELKVSPSVIKGWSTCPSGRTGRSRK
jgi:LacI family transcriptional regulator